MDLLVNSIAHASCLSSIGVYSPNAVKGTGLPGTFNVDYAFLNASTVNIWVNQNHVCLPNHTPSE